MKKAVITLSVIIIVLTFVSSLLGTLSYQNKDTRAFETARGEQIELINDGINKNNSKKGILLL